MNTIQDNTNFIRIIYEDGLSRDVRKKLISEVRMDKDSNSLFLDMIGDKDISLQYFDCGIISDPEYPYPSLMDFYTDLHNLLNYSNPELIYPNENLVGRFSQEAEGEDLIDIINGIIVPYVSRTGLDQIFDFSVLVDDRFNKNAYLGNSFSLPEYYNFPYVDIYFDTNNPYYWKLKDFHYANFLEQSLTVDNIAFLKAKATTNTSNVLDEVSELVVYSSSLEDSKLSKTLSWIGIQDTFYGDDLFVDLDFTNWDVVGTVYNVTTETFTVDENGGVRKLIGLEIGREYLITATFTTTQLQRLRIYNYGINDAYFDYSHYIGDILINDTFIAKTDPGLHFRTGSITDTITISNYSLKQVYENYYKQ